MLGLQSEAVFGTAELAVYNVYLYNLVCLDEELAQLVASELVLAVAPTIELDLDPVRCQ
jgi:hypothetical protein